MATLTDAQVSQLDAGGTPAEQTATPGTHIKELYTNLATHVSQTAIGSVLVVPGTESSHAIDCVCAVVDYTGAALAAATEVKIESFAVTDSGGDLAAATAAVGTVVKVDNPATGVNNLWMTTGATGLFSFKCTDAAAESVLVKIEATGCRPKVLALTFAG